MERSQLTYTTFAMLFIAAICIGLNLLVLSPVHSHMRFLSINDVRAVSLHQGAKPRFLASQERRHLLEILNAATLVEEMAPSFLEQTPYLPKVEVHRFDHPSIELIPEGMSNNQVIFRVEGLGKQCFLIREHSEEFGKLIDP